MNGAPPHIEAHQGGPLGPPPPHPPHIPAPGEGANIANGGGPPGLGSGLGAGPNAHANPATAAAESHNQAIRSVIEKGNILNHEAAREQGHSVRRKEFLPGPLGRLENETEECYATIGAIQYSLGNHERALGSYEKALAKNPFNLKALVGLSRFYRDRDPNNFNRIIEYASRALAIDETGEQGEVWGTIGHALLLLGQLQKAYSCYQQAIAKAVKKDDPKLWYGIGVLYDRYGSMEHAEEAFASVLKLDPNFHKRDEVFFRLGIIYKLQGKADASLECFHYILQDPPEPLKQVDVWYQIGHALELKKDLPAAKDAYERVLRTTPDHSKVLQHLGGIYMREHGPYHDPEKSIAYITQSLEHDPQDPFSWYLLGRAFMQLNNYGKAYEAYQQAVYRDGKNPAYWCSIGVLYFNINQFHDALDAYTRAVRLHPFIPEIWQNLGTLYESCHDQLADAMDAYQRAIDLDSSNTQLISRLNEIKAALRTGTDAGAIQASIQPPPVPQDIMPDSKSWITIHFDVNGAKPVYLDSKALLDGGYPAQAAAAAAAAATQGAGLANGVNSGHASPDHQLLGGGSNSTSLSNGANGLDPRVIPSPTSLAGLPGPPSHQHPAAAGPPPGYPPSSNTPINPPPVGPPSELRRTSLTRPGTGHSQTGPILSRPMAEEAHPSRQRQHPHHHHHHHHHHHPQHLGNGRPGMSGPPAPGMMEIDRDPTRRVPSATAVRAGYPGTDRQSPPIPHEGPYGGNNASGSRQVPHSPINSPRMRAPPNMAGPPGGPGPEYDYPPGAGPPGRHPYHPSHGGMATEAEWDRLRAREIREREREREFERAGRYMGSSGGPLGRDEGPRHPGDPNMPSPPPHSSHHTGGYHGSSSVAPYGRDYPPPPHHSQAPGPPQIRPTSPPRYDDRGLPPGAVAGPGPGPAPGSGPSRGPAAPSRYPSHYPYDSYYPGGPPPPPPGPPSHPSAGRGGPGPSLHHHYADMREDGPGGGGGGGRYLGSDPRYDPGPHLDPRERELMHERELQARRAMEEEERRRREMESSRREISPQEPHPHHHHHHHHHHHPTNHNTSTPERRGVQPPPPASSSRAGAGGPSTSDRNGPPSGGKGKARSAAAAVPGNDESPYPATHSQSGSAMPSPLQGPVKERKRKVIGGLASEPGSGGRKKANSGSDATAAPSSGSGKIKIRMGGGGKGAVGSSAAAAAATASPVQSPAPFHGGGGIPHASYMDGRRVDEDYDDETDTANALIGLAGAALGVADPAGASHLGNQLKRPISPRDDHPMKKPRSDEEGI